MSKHTIAISANAHGGLVARSDMARRVHDSYMAFRDHRGLVARVKAVLEAREG